MERGETYRKIIPLLKQSEELQMFFVIKVQQEINVQYCLKLRESMTKYINEIVASLFIFLSDLHSGEACVCMNAIAYAYAFVCVNDP